MEVGQDRNKDGRIEEWHVVIGADAPAPVSYMARDGYGDGKPDRAAVVAGEAANLYEISVYCDHNGRYEATRVGLPPVGSIHDRVIHDDFDGDGQWDFILVKRRTNGGVESVDQFIYVNNMIVKVDEDRSEPGTYIVSDGSNLKYKFTDGSWQTLDN